MKNYTPEPLNTKDIVLSADMIDLREKLAKNVHDAWAEQRLREGWKYGEKRDDDLKTHPSLIPYNELPECEKEYDRITVDNTLKAIIKVIPSCSYDDPFLVNWTNEEYEENTYKPEQLIYQTLKGHKVRSKSERFIADSLFELKIPYRYEFAMYFNGHKLCPDFVILKPNGEFIIWEHFGLLDDINYQNNAIKKVKLYNSSGYNQYRNLICTKEDDLKDISVIYDIIQRFYFS